MVKLIFATHNRNKFQEIEALMPASIQLMSLYDLKLEEEIPETGVTLEENAAQKSFYVYERFGYACFADDTGLEVAVLNGAPGVFSARYAGEQKRAEDNIDKLLHELHEVEDRRARFRTAISLVIEGEERRFEGIVDGTILKERSGTEGFGYDPIFQPEGYERSFAEMTMKEKNAISHRGRAVEKLLNYLNMQYP